MDGAGLDGASDRGPSLLRDRAFLRYFVGETVSLGGTEITLVVLPILVFQLTGSPLQTATLTAIQVLPYLVFGLFAGAVADRVDRRRLMVACDMLNVLLLASIPAASALGILTVPQIYVVAALSATAFVWFDAANFGALPYLVGRDRIVTANSVM